MGFDLFSSLRVRERQDGLYEKDTFDIASAVTVDESALPKANPRNEQIGIDRGAKWKAPLTPEERAQAVVELTGPVGSGLRAEWKLRSPEVTKPEQAILNTVITGGLYPVVQGVRGAADTTNGGNLLDRVWRGIMEPDVTKRIIGKGKDYDVMPVWAKITTDVLEDIGSYGLAGAGKAVLNEAVTTKNIITKIENAANSFAEEVAGKSTTLPGAPESADLFNKAKRFFVNKAWSNISAIEAEGAAMGTLEGAAPAAEGIGTTAIQRYANKPLLSKIVDGLKMMTESGQLALPKVGQTVIWQGQLGKIIEQTGERYGIQLLNEQGRTIVAMASQLAASIPQTGKSLQEIRGNLTNKGVDNYISEGKYGITVSKIIVQKNERGRGIGTEAMNQIIEYADRTGQIIMLTPDTSFGATSVNRLKDFYKRFGFVENKGRNKNFQLRETMYRNPIKQKPLPLKEEPESVISYVNDKGEKVYTKALRINEYIDDIYTDAQIEELQKQGYDAIISDAGENEVRILNSNALSPTGAGQLPPKEPPPTTVSGAPEPEDLGKMKPSIVPAQKVKGVVRASTGQIKVGDVIDESEALKRMLGQEEKLSAELTAKAKKEEEKLVAGAMKQFFSYIDDIAKLEKELAISNYNTEAEKIKAQDKLAALKEKYAAAKEERDQKEALRREVAEITAHINKMPGENIAIEYQDMINKIKDKFDLKNRKKTTIAQRENMKAYVERMKVEGKPITIPADDLAMLDKVNLKDMTMDHLRQLRQTIDDLATLGKTKLRARKNVYEAKKERVKAELLKTVSPMNSKQLPKVPIGDKINTWVKRAIELQNYAQKTGVGLTPIDGLAEITGMTEMKKALDADFSKYLTHNDAAIKQWYELTKNFTDKEFQRIGVYAAARQEGGLERLANSGISADEVNAIKLTAEEEKAYKFVIDTFDKEYPAVKEYSKDVYNAEVGKQENYVSFMSDYEQMSDLEIYQRFGQTPEQIAQRKTKTVEQGFTKERAAASNIKLETNIDKIFRRHMDDVAYMLNTGKNIKMYFEIVNSPEMREKLGDTGTLAWLQWLDLMARKGGTEGAKRIALLDIARQNIGAGVLSFRLSSALVQFSSFADTIATMGEGWATKGAVNIATSKEWRAFIMDNFPEIRKSVGDDIAFREFGETAIAKLANVGTKPLQFLDGIMRSTAASAAYEKVAAEKGIAVDLKNPNAELIAEATKLMRNSQGSSFFKDQPLAITAGYGLMDNKSLNKTILTFQSFMLSRWDNINRQIWRAGIKEKNYGKAISSVFWLLVFAGAVEEGIRRTARKATGSKRDEADFAAASVGNMVQSVPLLGQLVSAITYSSNPVPALNTLEQILSGTGRAFAGKKPETRARGYIDLIGSTGSLLGIPGSTQIAQLAKDNLINKTSSKARRKR